MIGDMIARIRKDKNMSNTELAEQTNINIGHLTHIEKGERSPSYKALKAICKALDVPSQPTLFTIDKNMDEVHKEYKLVNHISYQEVPAVNIENFISCPASMASASMAIKINDDSMEPKLKQNTYAYIEFNTPLDNRDIGLFWYDGKLLIRRFIIRKDGVVLRAEDKSLEDICIDFKGDFYIVGKVVGSTEEEK